jgi:hypothetical protein
MPTSTQNSALDRSGFTTIPDVFSVDEVKLIRDAIESALCVNPDSSEALRGGKSIIGGRNLLKQVSISVTCWRKKNLVDLLKAVLGEECGLVRGLYFDKPPEKSWSLPWHKDLTIAVKQHISGVTEFIKPTLKAGVPHFEAPLSILQRMLTLRIHLDEMNDENGPVQVIPASHMSLTDNPLQHSTAETIRVASGGVFVMRPLLTHCSISSRPGNQLHRRILHLEFAADRDLPEGIEWHDFFKVAEETVDDSPTVF